MSKKNEKLQRYQVALAGCDDWKDVDSTSAARAGEVWAEANWDPSDGEQEYDLDVKEPSGKLIAVTVDVSMDVSFSGFATRHPDDDGAP